LLRLPFSPSVSEVPPFSVLGTGQLGQAFLALTYFLSGRTPVSVHLLDRELFEDFNQRTQILLSERIDRWSGKPKSEYLADICRTWGWNVFPERKEIQWSWKHGGQGQPLAFLGFDNMDARRIAVEGGFQWIFECGVGTDFCQPRVSWHSIPPERLLAKTLFADVARKTAPSAFAGTLSESPAECGRVIFENIQASAPSLGLVAVALTWVEIARFLAGGQEARSGAAYLWSPLLPLHRELLNPLFVEPRAA
jgi:hypothetical protein